MRALGDGLLWDLAPEQGWSSSTEAAVLLLPGVGGGPADFAHWIRHLTPGFRILSARCPRRTGGAAVDPAPVLGPATGLAEPAGGLAGLAARLADLLTQHITEPLLIFGHSMGAALGYETAWQLAHRRQPALALHACAALSPPEYAELDLNSRAMDDDTLTGLATALAIPLPRGKHTQRYQEALRAVRADLALIDAYEYGPCPRPLDYPVTVWSARDDTVIPTASARRWQPMSRHPITHHTLPVAHHCLNTLQAIEPITRALRREGL
ncbi:thioesterase domain-containing protein [Streptomyces roseoverticillatus]|uniref:thioesterase II family protein n=1 Tax=Streptomyces roseoverticillatus TaxID=66429 RepID=UPI0033F13FED